MSSTISASLSMNLPVKENKTPARGGTGCKITCAITAIAINLFCLIGGIAFTVVGVGTFNPPMYIAGGVLLGITVLGLIRFRRK